MPILYVFKVPELISSYKVGVEMFPKGLRAACTGRPQRVSVLSVISSLQNGDIAAACADCGGLISADGAQDRGFSEKDQW